MAERHHHLTIAEIDPVPEAGIGGDTALTQIDPVECLIGKSGAATAASTSRRRATHPAPGLYQSPADPGLQNGMKRPRPDAEIRPPEPARPRPKRGEHLTIRRMDMAAGKSQTVGACQSIISSDTPAPSNHRIQKGDQVATGQRHAAIARCPGPDLGMARGQPQIGPDPPETAIIPAIISSNDDLKLRR